MTTPARPRNIALTCSAVLLSLVLLFQLTRAEPAALAAADVGSVGDFTMLNLATSSEDLLLVLDGRNETLSVYRVVNKNSLELTSPNDIEAIFNRGKRIGAGTK